MTLHRDIGPQRWHDVVGLLPAAGQANRIAPLPCSKEIFPIGFRSVKEGQELRPKAVCQYLLERMQLAGIRKVYLILREGKWDIPTYLGDGHALGMHLAYLMMRLPYGVPFTLDQAYPFVRKALVVFGFPDILFRPDDVFVHLLDKQAATGADLVLGLFLAHQPHKMDMVDLDADNRVRSIIIKPIQTHLRYTWLMAVWTPAFTEFLHEYLEQVQGGHIRAGISTERELFIGDVIHASIEHNLRVESVLFPKGDYVDIGTPEDLVRAIRDGAQAHDEA